MQREIYALFFGALKVAKNNNIEARSRYVTWKDFGQNSSKIFEILLLLSRKREQTQSCGEIGTF